MIRERLIEASDSMMAQKAEQFGPENMRNIEKQVLLQAIDGKWRDHLLTLEHLRSVVGFRGYAQRDPLNEYKNESFQLFESMLDSLRTEVTQKLGQIRPMTEEEQQQLMSQMQERQAGAQVAAAQAAEDNSAAPAATETTATTDRLPLLGLTRMTRPHGATLRAMTNVPADLVRNSSIATASLRK